MSKFKINPSVDLQNLVNTHYASLKLNESMLVKALIGENDLDKLTVQSGEFYIQSAYTAIYGRINQEIVSMYRVLEAVRQFYLVETIISQITDDALAPRVGSDDIIKFSCKDESIQKELDELVDDLGLNSIIQNITPDLIFYGSYTLETSIEQAKTVKAEESIEGKEYETKPKGIVALKDNVDQGSVVPLTQEAKKIGYLSRDRFSGQIKFHTEADFIHFSLGGSRIRVDLNTWLPDSKILHNKQLGKLLDSIPRYIRIGKSIFYGMTNKLRELELLEKLVPATKINKLSQGNILGISLPENYDLKAGMLAARELEGMINRKVNVDPQTGELTAEAILSIAGRTRVVPTFGDKGDVSRIDTKSEDVDDITGQTKELREMILDSIGVPSELIYKSENDASKNDTLKRYSKYLRKLKRVQKAISEGCLQVAYIHLAERGFKFEEKDVEVVFLNSLIEIDNLDRLEYADVTTGLLKNLKDFFNDLADESSPYKAMVDLEKVAEFMEGHLKTVGLADALKLKKEGGQGIINNPSEVQPDDADLDLAGLEDETEVPSDVEPELGSEEEI